MRAQVSGSFEASASSQPASGQHDKPAAEEAKGPSHSEGLPPPPADAAALFGSQPFGDFAAEAPSEGRAAAAEAATAEREPPPESGAPVDSGGGGATSESGTRSPVAAPLAQGAGPSAPEEGSPLELHVAETVNVHLRGKQLKDYKVPCTHAVGVRSTCH